MSMIDNHGQIIFGDLGGLKLPDICLTGEEIPRKNLTQETCPDRGTNPGPLRDKRRLPLAPQRWTPPAIRKLKFICIFEVLERVNISGH